jgi:NAD(P)-dependent dehydrogenase (short-subunit alcohol dehydrogenase family)
MGLLMRSLKQEVVVITGASAGVGRATVRAFARRGAKIGLIARGIDGLKATQREVEALGSEAIIISCDVADAAALDAAGEEVEATFGPIDVWINVAFAGVMAPFLETPLEDYSASRRSPIWARSTARWRLSNAWCLATEARSSLSVRPLLIAAFRCSRPIAVPSTRSRDSRIRCAAN